MKLPHLLSLFLLSTTALFAEDVVDNLANTVDSSIEMEAMGNSGAQAFTTGPDTTTLSEITVDLEELSTNSEIRVKLWSGDRDIPETEIEDLGTATLGTSGNLMFSSTSFPLLAPLTRYWVTVTVETAGDADWRNTTDGTITGVSTGALPEVRATSDDGNTWTPIAAGHFQLMKVVTTLSPTLTVTNALDDDSDGSLRKTITGASAGSRIIFDAGLEGQTIRLDGAELRLTKNLTIDASMLDGGITISGDTTGDGTGDSRVIMLRNGPVVTLKSLTITGGNGVGDFGASGGGVYFSGATLIMEGCNVTGNASTVSGGGIYSIGPLIMKHCTIANNMVGDSTDSDGGSGGGILNYSGNLTMERCSIVNNQAGNTTNTGSDGGNGGGVYCRRISTFRQCTISNNRAGNSTDGDGGDGGGIYAVQSAVTLEQCTVTGNQAGNGSGSGIGGDGGGVFGVNGGNGRDIFFTDCLIAGNLVGTGATDGKAPDFNRNSLVFPSGVNLIGDNTLDTGSASTVFPAPNNPGEVNINGDFVGTSADPLDPLLGDLADNGGLTLTHLPLRGSPALDPIGGAIDPGHFPNDQRGEGFPRIVVGIQDIGAVEAPDYAAIDAAAEAEAAAQAAAAAAARAQAAARAAQIADLSKKLKKLKKKFKNAKRKGQAAKSKKIKGQIKKLTKQMRSL